MTLSMELWTVSDEKLISIDKASLDLEKRLENWIEDDISLIGIDALIVGRQVQTSHGGYIDLLAINSDGDLILIELKRRRTPRDIVAQCLDYGTWVYDLRYEDLAAIYEEYEESSLDKDFAEYFDTPIPEKINNDYQTIIVAESVDDSTERIVQHLNEVHKVNINVVFFNVFLVDGKELIGRSWLKDPVEVEEKSSTGKKAKWSGYYFVNTGIKDDNARDWGLNLKHGFVSAGAPRFIRAIKNLKKNDRFFAYIKGNGYVGYGVVEEEAVFVKDFISEGTPITDSLPEGHPWKQHDDPSTHEWLVRVNWLKIYKQEDAQWFKGAFANQNVVCRLREPNTFKFLVDKFGVDISG